MKFDRFNGCKINKNRTDRKALLLSAPARMKNKDRYNLKDLKFRAIRDRRQDFRLPLRHWKIEIFKDGEHIETKYCEGGSITDLMAWLESEEE